MAAWAQGVLVLYLTGLLLWCLQQSCQGSLRDYRNKHRTRIVGRKTW